MLEVLGVVFLFLIVVFVRAEVKNRLKTQVAKVNKRSK